MGVGKERTPHGHGTALLFAEKKGMLLAMRPRIYFAMSAVAFVAGTLGSDIIARTSIAGESFAYAAKDHLYWAAVQGAGTILLLAPYLCIALICAAVDKRARTRSALFIFVAGTVTLLYFYFEGYQGAQYALLEQRWTAATLSIGLLPFFIGFPLVLLVAGAGAIAAALDRRAVE